MYYDKAAPWEHYPKNLRFNEVQNPLLVVIDFFSATRPKDARKGLKRWRNYVISKKPFKDERHGPGSLLFTYDLNLKLMEAMHLLLWEYNDNWQKRNKKIEIGQLETERREWRYFPRNLPEEELLDPYITVKKCFKKLKPQHYRVQLKEWLHFALYKHAANETLSAGEVVEVYENLLLLYSAAWLIHQRETGETLICKESGEAEIFNEAEESKTERPIEIKEIIPELTAAGELGLAEINKLIVERIPFVNLIVYLGKHDEPFTYYLLVLVDDGERIPEHEIGNKIEDNCRYLGNVYAIVHKVNSAIEGINNGQRFWSKAISKGRIIYKAPELELPEIKTVSKDVLIERAKFHWRRWGMQGKEFLKGAERYNAERNYRLAAFLLHQSVESVLKAIIQAILGYRVQIHNLSRLLRLTLLFTDAFKNVFELDTTEGSQIYHLLQSAYTQSRYKNEFDPDKESIYELEQKVKLLFDIAERVYYQYFTSL
jgi:HEPN domain-containing protein